MYGTYLRRELAGRVKQTVIVALGLAIAIALVIVVNALSAGVRDAQSQALSSVYGVGTDLTVTGAQTEPGQGGGTRFDFGAGEGATQDGTTTLSQSRLMTDMRRGTLDASTVATVTGLDGVAAATGALSLTNTTFSGQVPDRSAQSGGTGGSGTGDGAQMAGVLHDKLAKRAYLKNKERRRELSELDKAGLVAGTRPENAQRYAKAPRRAEVEILDGFGNVASVRLQMDEWVDYMHLVRAEEQGLDLNRLLFVKYLVLTKRLTEEVAEADLDIGLPAAA